MLGSPIFRKLPVEARKSPKLAELRERKTRLVLATATQGPI